jgi:dTDP-4-dehydrorhamnose reductase
VRVVVTGADGQVGALVVARLGGHDVIAANRRTLDLAQREHVEQVLGELAPDVVINCAAYTDVDGCERNPGRAYAVNALGVRHLAVAAARVDAHVVHVSTDFVFDGALGRPYREWDDTHPLSEYGRSKLGGEQELQRHGRSWAIARTAWVYGKPGQDFVSWVVKAHAAGELTGIADDQYGSPTYADDLARVLVDLTVRRSQGVFHCMNEGRASRWEQGVAALEARGVDASGVARISAASLDRPAVRPDDSTLESHALQAAGIEPLRKWEDALVEYVTGPLRVAGAVGA